MNRGLEMARSKTRGPFAAACAAALMLGAIGPSRAQPLPAATAMPAGAAGQAAAAPEVRRPPAVHVVHPVKEMWAAPIDADGYVMPWQEIPVGSEIGGLRLSALLVNVGDSVKKGQVLARLDASVVETDLESAKAQLAEAEATRVQAAATLERAKRLAPSGGVSQLELMRYETQTQTAEARVAAANAQVKQQQFRLANTTLVAPDAGIVSSVAVSEGMIVPAGNELCHLIRQGRLEWRAEVSGETLLRLTPGLEVVVKSPLGDEVKGRIRRLAPTIDIRTHQGLVYVDLPAGAHLKAGLRVSGSIRMGKRVALVVPESVVRHQDGRDQVWTVNAAGRVELTAVTIGRRASHKVEVLRGLDEHDQVVDGGQNALSAGQLVQPEAAEGEHG